MSFTRALRLVAFVVIAWCAAPTVCFAQGQSAEDKQRLAELNRNAESGRAVARIASRGAAVACGLALVGVAWNIARKGLEVREGKRVTGRAARVIAVLLATFGMALGAGGAVYLPSLFGPGGSTRSDPQQELARLQGEWILERSEVDGKRLPREGKEVTMIVRGDEVWYSDKQQAEVKIALSPERDPPWIDSVGATDPTYMYLGIYRLNTSRQRRKWYFI